MSAGKEAAHNIVVTGGAGFIGSNLARSLLADGYAVTILDNLSRVGVDANVAWLRRDFGTRVTFHQADVLDADPLRRVIASAEAVFHFAAQTAVTTSLLDPIADFDVNARGTLNVLESVRKAGRQIPVIFSSTNKVYGGLDDIRMIQAADGYAPESPDLHRFGISEQRPLDFCTPYGCSKGVADQYVLDYAKSFGLPAAVLRMSCIYGPRQFGTEDQGWVAHFLIAALKGDAVTVYGNGEQVRDILFIDDAVAAYRALLADIQALSGRAFNLGGGRQNAVSVNTVLAEIEHLTGRPLARRFDAWRTGDQLYFVADTRALSAAVGWRAKTGWRDGLQRLAEWLTSERGLGAPERRIEVPA